MNALVIVRCGLGHGKRSPRLAAVGYEDGVLIVEWSDLTRDPVKWEGTEAITPVRPRGLRRREPLGELLSGRRALSSGERVFGEAYIVLHCRTHGTVLGPRWNDLAESTKTRPAPVTLVATRRPAGAGSTAV